ncbi:TonB-dependent receptor [Aliikangiella maris]|uniref:TonB-dependent receptor n=2 Tax=Aliikangiella maris TaxID=3162458 RepID=A0ABV2BRA1_9GAMM
MSGQALSTSDIETLPDQFKQSQIQQSQIEQSQIEQNDAKQSQSRLSQPPEFDLQLSNQVSKPDNVIQIISSRHQQQSILNTQLVTLDETISLPSSMVEMALAEPGLAVNGQPGLFQTLSIRGMARQRIQVFVEGMQITSERRAGIAASFIDPGLLSGIEITQGPASTYYGSGAIGGTLHLNLRRQSHPWLISGYDGDGHELMTALGAGGDNYSVGIAYRNRQNGRTADDQVKYDQFAQHNVYFTRQFNFEQFDIDWLLIQSEADNIGKDNLRYPSRITRYPHEEHWLSRLTLSQSSGWQAQIYFHDQQLITEDLRPEKRMNRVINQSLDSGLSVEKQWQWAEFNGQYGIDYFARRNVESVETEISLIDQQQTRFQSLIDGRADESAMFFMVNKSAFDWLWHVGLRANYLVQSAQLSEKITDNYTTYFFGAEKQIDKWNLRLNYGTGFRFASLSERLFDGSTGQGQNLGNPLLIPEKSRSLDVAVNYKYQQFNIDAIWFKTTVDDLIERVSIDDERRTFRNLTQGKVSGWQYQLDYELNDFWQIALSGQSIRGNNQLNLPLADIPPDRHRLSLAYHPQNWSLNLSYIYRLAKNEAGDGERPLSRANLLDMKFNYQISPLWQLQISAENLLDERYYHSADDLSTYAVGRHYGMAVKYYL